MLVKGLSRIAMTLCAMFTLTSCLAGEDLPGEDPIDNPDLGVLTENVALPPPTLLTVTAVNPNAETITWSAVNDPTLKYYIVDRGSTPATVGTLTSVPPTKTTWTSTNLVPNTQYCWGVRDVNTLNQVSLRSNIICVTTPGSPTTPAPTGLVATAISDSRITLTWNAVANTSVYHVFFRVAGGGAFTGLATVAAPTTTFTAANLTANTTYEFVVTAVTVAGESPQSNIASATTFVAGLEGYWRFDENAGGSSSDRSGFARSVTLAGAAFSPDVAPVRSITDSIDPDRNVSVLSIGAGAGSQATSTTAGAFRFAGASFSFSGWVKLPAAVATDIVGEQAAGCGTLGWKLGQNAVNGLNISGAGGTQGFGTTLAANVWTHVGFSYDANTTTLVTYVNGTQTTSVPYSPKSSLTTVPLTFGHVGGCAGGAVLIDEARIYSRALTGAEMAAFGRRPAPPTIAGTAPFANTEIITWTPDPAAHRYAIYKGTAPGNETFFTQVPTNQVGNYVGQHLDPLTTYTWFVRVETAELDSDPSNEIQVTTPDVPAAPANFRVTNIANHAVGLAWDASANAKVYRITMSGAATGGQAVLAPTTTAVFSNLAPGTYQFTILVEDTAVNTGHTSAPVTAVVP
jgi:hypothetical protein